MGNSFLQLIALAAVAIFLIFKLRKTLGTRDGFEKPRDPNARSGGLQFPDTESETPVVDREISKYVDAESESAKALAAIKSAGNDFMIADFVEGAKAAYEMILLAYANGKLEEIEPYVSDEVYGSFAKIVSERETDGLTHETRFVGLRESGIRNATFDEPHDAEITMEFTAELISFVTDRLGEIVVGDDRTVRRQKDVWTFARSMKSSDPNWMLVATDE